MALRSLDNALPAKLERPKKTMKVATLHSELPLDSSLNNENTPPQPKASDPSAEYIASEDLQALSDPGAKIKVLWEELESKDWTKVCEALNDVRRLALHHSALLLPILENVMLIMVKSLKNPRSALCKTAIMTSTDIFHSFGHILLSASDETKAFDNLLLQLLLKASQDKRFVCEEAQKALDTMAQFTTPLPLLKKLQSCVNHVNLRVRAKAAVSISKCVSNMELEIIKEFGLGTLLQIAAELLNDRLPDAREAARSIINVIHSGFPKKDDTKENDDEEETSETWQSFCSSNLPPISAQSVAKLVSQ
ncbi:uncharacterized protein A4U43_C05F9360 [Asparagus officinalis]|uniref:TOG domain-containing protein n=1 Tax=Asparagus officinalis TaxID=4686 RepID=A0A5P1ET18_ASPOF|nr:uncharacterized protein LOC109842681 [Asparagus officinalis]ONK68257.1 uncharacterized protein A4U43_C05F9360 [Asparagus officinalis]